MAAVKSHLLLLLSVDILCCLVSAYLLPMSWNLRNLQPLQESNDNFQSANNRFLLRSHNTVTNITVETLDEIVRETNAYNEITRIVYGIAIFPGINTVVPIHDGIFQSQHINVLPAKIDPCSFITCGFAPRAGHVTNSPNEKDRPIDSVRLNALNVALQNINSVSPEELLGPDFDGTPPARIYRSFVAPRPKAARLLEPVERIANRTAQQIELGVRCEIN